MARDGGGDAGGPVTRTRAWWLRHVRAERSGVGLAVVRVAYAAGVLGEIAQIAFMRGAIFDSVPYVERVPLAVTVLLGTWAVAVAMIALGWHYRRAALVNVVLTWAFIGGMGMGPWEYHVDYTILSMGLLLPLLPLNARASVDARNGRRTGVVTHGHHLAIAFVGIALVYFDSVFHKVEQDMWMSGLGVWKPASVVTSAWLDHTWMLDVKWLMLALGYFVLVFEALLLFLLPARALHLPLALLGQAFHVGIGLCFPIPLFAWIYVALYFALYPEWVWDRLTPRRITTGVQRGTGTAASGSPAGASSGPPRRVALRGLGALVLFLGAAQGLSLLASPFASRVLEDVPEQSWVQRVRHGLGRVGRRLGAQFTGTTPHGVFVDNHFAALKRALTLVHVGDDGTETWMPWLRRTGQSTPYVTGRVWAFYTFRASLRGGRFDADNYERGTMRLTSHWIERQGLDRAHQDFKVMMRPVRVPDEWERGFLRRELDVPWTQVGTAHWRGGRYELRLDDLPDDMR